jgi:hypothetical protein
MHPVTAKAWEALPKVMRDVIAMAVDAVLRHPTPAAPQARAIAPIRLFITPANYAGQGFRWARAVDRAGYVTASNSVCTEINPFGYPADHSVRGRTMTHSWQWQREQLAALTSEFTHLLVEAQMPPLGGRWNHNLRRQVAALRAGGLTVGMLCHGSDIRLPSRHAELEQWSPFAAGQWKKVEKLERVMAANRAELDGLGLPTFVSTPGLLLDVPYAHLLPVVIATRPWASNHDVLVRKRPIVVHVPSNALLKGTAQIEPGLRRLHDEGLIEYQTISGRTHDEMPAIYGAADIVLDQFRLGDYGAAACESMAAGRLVISHVSDQARAAVKAVSGFDLPILEANIDTLEQVLRGVLRNRDTARALAQRGPAFVQAVHDGSLASRVLHDHFLDVS